MTKLMILNLKNHFAIFKESDEYGIQDILFNEMDADTFYMRSLEAKPANEMDSYSQRLTLRKYFRKIK